MARLPLVDPASLTGAEKEQYERFPSNLTRALLLLDERLAGQLPQVANALRTSSLDAAWREGVILRVAALQRSDYERFQHLGQARQSGWTAQQIEAIELGRFDAGLLSADFVTVLRFVDEVVAGPFVPDDMFAAARHALGDRGLVTVIVLVGHYMTVARLLRVLEVELDDAPDAWTSEH